MNHAMVLVEWVDAHAGDPGWLTLDEYEVGGEAIVHTVGFLIGENEPGGKPNHVNLWATLSEGDGIGPFHIPSVMVRKVSRLGVVGDLTHP